MKSKPKLMCRKCFKKPMYKSKTTDGQIILAFCDHNKVATIYNTVLDSWTTVNPITLEDVKRNLTHWANHLEYTQNNLNQNCK